MMDMSYPEGRPSVEIESLEVEARRLAHKRQQTDDPQQRQVIDRQVRELEERIAALKRRFRP